MKKDQIYKISVILFLLDQWVKWMVQNYLSYQKEVKVIPSFFSLFYVKNKGAAFSLLEDYPIFLVIISILVMIGIHQYIRKEKEFSNLSMISLGMILGGILGNLLDRIMHHAVIDYLSFSFGKYHFPVFNLADICISIGIILLCFSFLQEERKKKRKNQKDMI